jgi:hypothetical protein
VCALTLGLAGSAGAAPWTWQAYTKDSTWHCGSTQYVGGLYLQPCVKISGASWQPIMVATATSQGRYIIDEQEGLLYANGNPTPEVVNDDYCDGNTQNLGVGYIPPWTSLACFSPTTTERDSLVEGVFLDRVSTSPTSGWPLQTELSSPGIRTGA